MPLRRGRGKYDLSLIHIRSAEAWMYKHSYVADTLNKGYWYELLEPLRRWTNSEQLKKLTLTRKLSIKDLKLSPIK